MQLEEDESVRTELLDARELDVLMDSPTQDYASSFDCSLLGGATATI